MPSRNFRCMCKSTMKKKHSEGVPFWILNDFNYEYIYIYLFIYLFMYFFYLMQSNLQVVAHKTHTPWTKGRPAFLPWTGCRHSPKDVLGRSKTRIQWVDGEVTDTFCLGPGIVGSYRFGVVQCPHHGKHPQALPSKFKKDYLSGAVLGSLFTVRVNPIMNFTRL